MKNFVRKIIFRIGAFYDALFGFWESVESQKWQANLLVIVFGASLLAIELSRQGFLPERLPLPVNHFYAVKLAFDLLLTLEILGLIFNLADSVANSMGKQFEIFSLILLRQSFKEFVHFDEPVEWTQVQNSVSYILSDALGALLIFGLVSAFYALQKHRKITGSAEQLASFIAAKKLLALILLIAFVLVGAYDLGLLILKNHPFNFFDVFYTVLIFSDILIVLVSLRYNSTYSVVFRNSGFAVATVIIRLALTAPPFFNVGLGVAALLISIGLTFVYNNFALIPPHSEITHLNQDRLEIEGNPPPQAT